MTETSLRELWQHNAPKSLKGEAVVRYAVYTTTDRDSRGAEADNLDDALIRVNGLRYHYYPGEFLPYNFLVDITRREQLALVRFLLPPDWRMTALSYTLAAKPPALSVN